MLRVGNILLALLFGRPAVVDALFREFHVVSKNNTLADKLVLMHTRKTGGTTLAKVLLAAKSYNPLTVDEGGCHPDPECTIKSFETPANCKSFGESHEHYWSRFVAVQNAVCPHIQLHHWDISGVLPLKAVGYKAITMVREPMSLLESSFNYGNRDNTFADMAGGKAAYFASWVETRQPIQEQLRMFTGCSVGRDHLFDINNPGASVNGLRDSINAESPGFCDSNMESEGTVEDTVNASLVAASIALKGALSNAEHVFDTILLTEAFVESVTLLERKHGLVVAGRWAVDHPTNTFEHEFRVSQLSERMQARLDEVTAIETKFYEAMVRRFVDDAKEYNVDLSGCKPCQPFA